MNVEEYKSGGIFGDGSVEMTKLCFGTRHTQRVDSGKLGWNLNVIVDADAVFTIIETDTAAFRKHHQKHWRCQPGHD